jgi:hypothetical protein
VPSSTNDGSDQVTFTSRNGVVTYKSAGQFSTSPFSFSAVQGAPESLQALRPQALFAIRSTLPDRRL